MKISAMPLKTDFSHTQAPRPDWLAKAIPEEPLDPEVPIIDAHMHLWHHRSGYRYFLEEYARDIADCGHSVVASVFVECNAMYRADGPEHLKSVGEIEFATGQAAMAASGKYTNSKVAAAIVGFSDLTDSDTLKDALDAHEAAANGRFRGIRMRAKWDADPVVKGAVSASAPGLYLEPTLRDGVKELTRRGLLFEASIYHPQLGDVTKLARSVPESTIVLNHMGSPVGHSSYRGREKEVHANWLRDIKELATCPNVSVKLGGLLMTLASFDFGTAERPPTSEELADLWRPYMEPCLEIFGPDRCLASSNFPVEKVGFPFGTIWNMFKHITSGCSKDEKAAVFSGNASRIYRI